MLQRQLDWKSHVYVAGYAWAGVTAGIALLYGVIAADKTIAYLGIATGLGTSIVSGLFWLAHGPCWNRWPFKLLHRDIQDLSGRWEGWYLSEFDHDPRALAHEIQQRGVEVIVDGFGATTLARSIATSLVTNGMNGCTELIWAYKTDTVGPRETAAASGKAAAGASGRAGDTHSGVHVLFYEHRADGEYLRGYYINDRVRVKSGKRGLAGWVEVKRTDKRMHHGLCFDESWAMPVPPNSWSNV